MSHWERSVGQSDEWYTPKYIFDALGCCFDLDVAAPQSGPPHVPCVKWHWRDSLELEWSGFIWMNPPFGGRNGLIPWMDKFLNHANGIALTPDRTSAPWFQNAWRRADAVLFIPKVKFLRPDGSQGAQPSNGTALWGVGDMAVISLKRAEKGGLGILAIPYRNALTEGEKPREAQKIARAALAEQNPTEEK